MHVPEEGAQMNKSGFSKQVAVAAGFLLGAFLAPGLLAQSAPPATAPPPAIAAPPPPAAQPRQARREAMDPFAGLSYTDEQKVKISEIRQSTKAKMDLVAKDDKLDAEQKQAMLQGYHRLEAGEIFKILTPEQQKEVRKKVATARAAEQQQRKAQQQQSTLPH